MEQQNLHTQKLKPNWNLMFSSKSWHPQDVNILNIFLISLLECYFFWKWHVCCIFKEVIRQFLALTNWVTRVRCSILAKKNKTDPPYYELQNTCNALNVGQIYESLHRGEQRICPSILLNKKCIIIQKSKKICWPEVFFFYFHWESCIRNTRN